MYEFGDSEASEGERGGVRRFFVQDGEEKIRR